MNVRNAISFAMKYMNDWNKSIKNSKNRIFDSKLEARFLVSHCIQKGKDPNEILPLNLNLELNQRQEKKLQSLLEKRCKGTTPLSYLIGTQPFYGRNFNVSRNTLIPRSSTELLIETCLKLYSKEKEMNGNGNENKKRKPQSILDLGTGSGNILITLANEFNFDDGVENENSMILVGVDKSKKALKIAQQNIESLAKRKEQIKLVESSWLENEKTLFNLSPKFGFELIVSNPPYIPKTDKEKLQLDVVKKEPHSALFAGKDGLEAYRKLSEQIQRNIEKLNCKWLVLEIGEGQTNPIRKIFE